ncbi:MAG: type II toxin-antitoxin system RelE/ParE family toxin [bacterium]
MAVKAYKLLYARLVKKELKKIPQDYREKIIGKIRALVHDPFPPGAVTLQGASGLFRIRSGDYRIIYEVRDSELIILVIKIGHRKEVYRKI